MKRRKHFINLVNKAAEGNHGKTAVLDLSELVALEVLLVGTLQPSLQYVINQVRKMMISAK